MPPASSAGKSATGAAGSSVVGRAGSGAAVTGSAGSAGGGGNAVASAAGGSGAAGGGGAVAGAGAPDAGASAAGIGAAGTAGATAANGGSGGAGSTTPPPTGDCGTSKRVDAPFGCKFAFGTNDPGGSLSAFAALQFMTKWVGYEVEQDGSIPKCDGCTWLTAQVASTPLVPVYYAYFIGYFGKKNGLPDGNEMPNGPNLTTDATQLIRDHRDQVIAMYASYAKQTAAVWKDKPLVWLLEGDFVQYAGESQKNRFTYDELGKLAVDISCAIRSQMPNAVVAINHSTWNSDQVTQDFWKAMDSANYDLVWTTGVANNMGFMEASAKSDSYNAATATYKYLHTLTGRNIFVDTSFGISGMSDSWSGATAEVLNQRIADGVIAANVTMPASTYVATVGTLAPMLKGVCQ